MSVSLHPRQLTRMLGILVVALTTAHLLGQTSRWVFGHDSVFGLVPLFDLNAETNVPTFYATLSLSLCGVLAALVARVTLRRKEPFALHWVGMSLGFFFLGLDEFASLHERLSEPVKSATGAGGVFTSAWVIPYGIGALLVGLTYLSFLRALPKATRNGLLLGGVVFVLGALGLEMAAGPTKAAAAGVETVGITIFTSIEEVLEMTGVLLVVRALAHHLAAASPSGFELRLTLDESAARGERRAGLAPWAPLMGQPPRSGT